MPLADNPLRKGEFFSNEFDSNISLKRKASSSPIHMSGSSSTTSANTMGTFGGDDYDSRTEHSNSTMDSDDESDEDMEIDAKEAAAQFKEIGNKFYAKKKYSEAEKLYTQALTSDPTNATYFNNRAATRLMLARYDDAISDCNQAIELDSRYLKAYIRLGDIQLLLGKLELALKAYQFAAVVEPMNSKVEQKKSEVKRYQAVLKQCQALFDKYRTDQGHNHNGSNSIGSRAAISRALKSGILHLEKLLKACPSSLEITILYLQLLVEAGELQKATKVSSTLFLMKGARQNTKALYARARALLLGGNLDMAVKHLRQAMQNDPDTKICRALFKRIRSIQKVKEEGNNYFKARQYQAAIVEYTKCLNLDPHRQQDIATFMSKTIANRALCYMKLGNYNQALQDCSAAIEMDPKYIKALMRRADIYKSLASNNASGIDQQDAQEYVKKGMADLNSAKDLLKSSGQSTSDIDRTLKEFSTLLKQLSRKDYYRILGVNRNATQPQIKKGYRKAALKWHPDRHATKSEKEQKKAENMFKLVGEAFGILSDEKKRRMYDQGMDAEQIEQGGMGMGGHGHGHGGHPGGIDPSVLFEMFMGGGMGGMGGSRRGSRGAQFHFG